MSMSSEKVNQIIEQPYALSPTMTDAPPPPYSSLYPVFGPMPSMNSALPTMSPFFPPQPNHPMAGAPQPTPLIAPPVPSNRPFPHHPQHQISAAAMAAAVASNISPQVNFGHMYPHGSLPHFIPTPTAAASQFVYQTVVPTTYGPVVMPVQIPNNTPPPMIGIPSDCYVDPRTAARFDDIARGTIPISQFGLMPPNNAGLMYNGHHNNGVNNTQMFMPKSIKKPYY